MRVRHNESRVPGCRQPGPRSSSDTHAQFVREFECGTVDLDHFAEAVRKLLATDASSLSGNTDFDLLSGRHRATHVVRGNGEP